MDHEVIDPPRTVFGIIGVGATELIQHPYWCLEKGYARWTGPREDTEAWAARARGWIQVRQRDAWSSMAVYTFTTIAFYMVRAAILGPWPSRPSDFLVTSTPTPMSGRAILRATAARIFF
jgi:hypothetical protein